MKGWWEYGPEKTVVIACIHTAAVRMEENMTRAFLLESIVEMMHRLDPDQLERIYFILISMLQ